MKSFNQFILENKGIIIPRRSKEEREKNYIIAINKKINKYVEDGSKGDLDLSNTPIKRIPDTLIEINGDLNLRNSKIEDLNNLTKVNGYLDLSNSNIRYLSDNLKEVKYDIYIKGSPLSNNKKLIDHYINNGLKYICV